MLRGSPEAVLLLQVINARKGLEVLLLHKRIEQIYIQNEACCLGVLL